MDPSEPSSGSQITGTARTRLRRMRERASFARADLDALLDAGFVCHLGLVLDGWPHVVPTSYGRAGDTLYVHGSIASRSLRAAGEQAPVCATVTHVDGLVLARSVFEHSINYRCAMVFGVPRVLAGEEKLEGLRVITEHVVRGQWSYARRPSRSELAQTTVLALGLAEASVKIRSGPPGDGDGPDADLEVWAGEVPLRCVATDPVADPSARTAVALAPHLERCVAEMALRLAPPAPPRRGAGR
jgi:nitroimidazol reductase NimA-like FMN-containing flavoprotein (pyridoxamine 5'-phosphate oxidase superfamily)